MASTMQLKLRAFSIVDYMQENWKQVDADNKITDAAGGIFSQFLSAVEDFFRYLIGPFNNILPPETRDDQIHHWLQYVAAHYLIAALVLIICICFFMCFCSCLHSIFSCIFSIVRLFFGCIVSIVKGFFSAIRTIFRCLMPCIDWGGRSSVKMMKAPGKAMTMIPRAAFELNPQGYFSALRGNPSSFVF